MRQVLDFHLTGNTALLEALFVGRMLLADFVEEELQQADIALSSATITSLESDEQWQFFETLQRERPALGAGELGALTVARFSNAVLLTNDKQARETAEDLGLPVHGSLGVLEYAVESDRVNGHQAVQLLEDMLRAGAWISDELLRLFRQKVFRED